MLPNNELQNRYSPVRFRASPPSPQFSSATTQLSVTDQPRPMALVCHGGITLARIRTLKPDWHTSGKQLRLSAEAALLFLCLLNHADDEGRMKDDELEIGARFPRNPRSVALLLGELTENRVIHRYSINGNNYLEIHDFLDHQAINRPTPSLIPSRSTHGAVTEDSRSTHGGKERKERKGKERNIASADAEFVCFWDSYPKRNGKKVGRSKASEVWQKLPPEDRTKSLASLIAQKKNYDDCKASGVFVAEFPDAHRWLRDRRFEDEVAEIPKEKTWQEKLAERLAAKGEV